MVAFLPLLSRFGKRLRLLNPIICGGLGFVFLLWMPAKAAATAVSLLRAQCVSYNKKVMWSVHQWCSYGAGIGGCQLSMTLTKRGKRTNASLTLSSNHPFRKKPFKFRYSMKSDRQQGLVAFRYWEGKKTIGAFLLRRLNKKKNLWVLKSRFRTWGKWSKLKPFHFRGRRLVMRCSF